MSFKVRATIGGTQELARALQDLAGKARNQAARKAATAGGQVVLREARRLAPKELGLLKKSLGKKVKVYSSGVGVAIIGPRAGFRQQVIRRKGKWAPAPPPPAGYANPTKYTHLAELGTYRTRAMPFLRPAAQGKSGEAQAAMANAVRQVLAGGA